MADLSAHHVGLTVIDLDRQLAFYRDVLGFDLLDRFTVSGAGFETGVGVPGATGTFAHLDAGGARIELVEYEPEGAVREPGQVNQPGAIHVGLAVDDIDAFFAGLPGDTETMSEPKTTESGARILFLRDPEGNLVELIER